jgi:cyclomaltodextrinase / maltogenic alpha-amylase / neopullulanase
MENKFLNRRGFLRLCVVAVGGTIVAACQEKLQDLPTATFEPATSTANPLPGIRQTGSDQDAWTWVKQINVEVAAECESIVVDVNGREFETQFENGLFTAEVRLSPGVNYLSAACTQTDGLEIRSNMLHYTERLRQVPTAVINIALDGEKIILHASNSQPAEADGSKIIDHMWSARPGNPAALSMEENKPLTTEVSTETIILQPPATDGEYYLRLKVKDNSGREDQAETYFVIEKGRARIPDYDTENPAWVETAVVYGVIPSKFGHPAFQAIIERLDDLSDLGINAIWLAPINISPPGDYGYAVVDYFDLNPVYGTKEDFHRMVQEAHARGIRVLMDFVPNHSSAQHPYFLSAKEGGPDSPYWDFYDRDASGEPTHYFDWTHLPNLNYENPEVRNMMIEAFAYWVREFDVDGFRVDACWGVKQRRPDFWPQWRKELKRIKPDLLLLAEASARDPYYFDNGFDVAYDWTEALGKWAWQVIWDTYKYRLLAYNLTNALTNGDEGFHQDALIFRFLNNNDTGQRFISRHGQGVTRVATLLLLTLPGVPCIYTGDELAEEFKPYEDSGPLSWIERVPGLREYHKQLIALRGASPSLHSRLWTPLKLEAARDQVAYGYLRYHGDHQDPILVLLNFTEEPTELSFSLPEGFDALAGKSTFKDLLSGESIAIEKTGDEWKVSLPGYGVRLLSVNS